MKISLRKSTNIFKAVAVAALLFAAGSAKAQTTVTIGTGTVSVNYLPLDNYYNYTYSQQIYTAAEIGAGGTAQLISSIAFQYAYATASTQKRNCTIYMANIVNSTFSSTSDWVPFANLTQVYVGPMNFTGGVGTWTTFNLTTPFVYNGTGNLLVCVHDNSGAYDGSNYKCYATSATSQSLCAFQDSPGPYTINPTFVSSGSVGIKTEKSNIKLTMTPFTCPSVRNLAVSNSILSWSAGGTEPQWLVEYGSVGFTPGTGTTVVVNTTPQYDFSALASGVYQFNVRPYCGVGDTGMIQSIVVPKNFTFCGGSGTQIDPYLICNETDLRNLATVVNAGVSYPNTYFRLQNNIALAQGAFTPIGNSTTPFRGHFDGNSKSITNLTMSNTSGDHNGLFGMLIGGSIKDLTVGGSVAGGDTTGGIVGSAVNSVIRNCVNNAAITGSSYAHGGIAGSIVSTKVLDCRNTGAIAGSYCTGGIVGYANTKSAIHRCSNTGTISNYSQYHGGIAGYFYNAAVNGDTVGIFACRNTGSVTGGSYTGGVVGYIYYSNVDSCYNTANLSTSGYSYVGGVAGYAYYTKIRRCSNRGNVPSSSYVGGICGYIYGSSSAYCYIQYCVNTGHITASTYVGGISGRTYYTYVDYNTNSGDVTSTSTSTSSYVGGIIGYSAANTYVRYNLNGGYIKSSGGAVGGIMGYTSGSTTNIVYNLNVNNVKGSANVAAIAGTGSVNTSNNYWDKQMCPTTYVYGTTTTNNATLGRPTSDFIGVATYPGTSYFTAVANMYPIPTGMTDSIGSKLAATPIRLTNNETVNNVKTNFTVGTLNSVSWTSSNTSVISVSGANATVNGFGLTMLTGTTGGMQKHIWLINEPTFCGGDGTQANPWLICRHQTLDSLAQFVNSGIDFEGKYFKVVNDLDLSSYSNWRVIGNSMSYPFKGHFDGNNKTISGLTITGSSSYRGLFGVVLGTGTAASQKAEIHHLTVRGSVSGSSYTGAIVGYADFTNFKKLTNYADVLTNNMYHGGIVGWCNTYCEFDSCYNHGDIAGGQYTGGITGYISTCGIITNCENTGTINSTSSYIGGIVGYYGSGTTTSTYEINNCHNRGEVRGSSCIGGIAGQAYYCRTRFCNNYGPVTSTSYAVGGIVGYNYYYSIISGSNNYGNVTSTSTTTTYTSSGYGVGGIAGCSYYGSSGNVSAIDSCNNYGNVTSSAYCTGGIVGQNWYYGHVNKSFNYGNVTGTYYVGGVCGFNRGYTSTTVNYNCHIQNSGNSGSVIGTYYVGGIVGRNGYSSSCYYTYVESCVNTGRVRGTYYVGGIAGQNYGQSNTTYRPKLVGCLNAGVVEATTNYAGGICGQTYSSTSYGILEYNLNVGLVKTPGAYKGGVEANSVAPTGCYYDSLMCPMSTYYYNTTNATYAKRTSALTDGTFNPSATYFTAANGLYPRPTTIANHPMTLLAATPVFLDETASPTDHVNNVNNCYTVGTGNGVSWASNDGSKTAISGSDGAVIGAGSAIITAVKDSASKEVDLTIISAPTPGTFAYTGSITGAINTPISSVFPTSSVGAGCTYACGNLPAGLSINPTTGEISGTPTAGMNATVTVAAVCSNCVSSTATVVINISPFCGGTGTAADPYLICTERELRVLSNDVNSGNNNAGVYYRLAANITMAGGAFDPIGTSAAIPFSGTFWGGGHSITNLTVTNNTNTLRGLFGVLKNAYVDSVTVAGTITGGDTTGAIAGSAINSTIKGCVNNAVIAGNYRYHGGIVGAMHKSRVIGCRNNGEVQGAYSYHGGIAGWANLASTISGCLNTGNITGSATYHGGIVGQISETTTTYNDTVGVFNSVNRGAVTGSQYTGGISGYSYYANFSGCVNNGTVTGGSSTYVAGVSGYSYGDASHVIKFKKCTDSANVTGYYYVGGISGYTTYARFDSCLNHGVITSTYTSSSSSYTTGGIAAWASYTTFKHCRTDAASQVLGYGYIGGIVGNAESRDTIVNCSNAGTVTGYNNYSQSYRGGIAGRLYGSSATTKCFVDTCVNTGAISGSSYIGGLFGYTYMTTVKNSRNSGTVTGSSTYVAGIAGYAYGVSTTNYIRFENDTNTGAVTGYYYVGGILAQMSNYGSIFNCVNSGDITSTYTGSANYNGGIVGYVYGNSTTYYDTIRGCVNSGSVLGSYSYVGGITGYTNYAYIDRCSNTDSVSGIGYIGGMVGFVSGYTNIYDCSNQGAISSTGTYTGGIVGYYNTNSAYKYLQRCTNSGKVTSTSSYVGGIAGYTYYLYCYHNTNKGDVTGTTYVGGIVGYAYSYTYCDTNTNFDSVRGTSFVGGIAGYMYGPSYTRRCSNRGVVMGTSSSVGGIVGGADGSSNSSYKYIQYNINSGEVNSTSNYVGGIAGQLYYAYCDYNINHGDVNSSYIGSAYVGGIVGYSYSTAYIRYNLNAGLIKAENGDYVGGIAGNGNGTSYVTYNLNVNNVTGRTYVAAITGSGQPAANNYWDKQMCPTTYWYSTTTGATYAKSTNDLKGVATYPSTSYFTAITDKYPVPTGLQDSIGAQVAASPIFLQNDETVSPVITNFPVSGGPATWTSSNPAAISISGTNATVGPSGSTTLTASSGGVEKHIFLIISPEAFCGGSGTKVDPWLICTAAQLDSLAMFVNMGFDYNGKYFRVVNNLDMSNYQPWRIIGNSTTHPFKGHFNGDSHTISNLVVNSGSPQYCGLFGYVTGTSADTCDIHDLVIRGSFTGGSYTGAVVGNISYGKIYNVTNFATISGYNNYHGGIAGYAAYTDILRCSNRANITGSQYTGGIVGYAVNGSRHVEYCVNSGHVTSNSSYVGGVAGRSSIYVQYCTNSGDVTSTSTDASSYVGGISGYAGSYVRYNLNGGYVQSKGGSVGGIAGYCGSTSYVTYNLNVNNVKGLSNTAAIVGSGTANTTYNYWDKQMCPTSYIYGTTASTTCAKTTAQLVGTTQPSATYFTSTSGLYPIPKGLGDSLGAKLAATPIRLNDPNEHVDSTRTSFPVGTANGVSWTSSRPSVISISGSSATVNDYGITLLTGTTQGMEKHIWIINKPVFCGGSGTQVDPYLICRHQTLDSLATYVNMGIDFYGQYFRVVNDLDLSSYSNWQVIGSSSTTPFRGNFDGDNHTISNLTITGTTSYRGLFGYVGGLSATDKADIHHLTVSGNVSGGQFTGGLVGYATYTDFKKITNDVAVSGSYNSHGGVAGDAYYNCVFDSCLNTATISGSQYTGGIVGGSQSNYYCAIKNSRNEGSINGTSSYTGGIVGYQYYYGSIRNCQNTAIITGYSSTGGIVGCQNYYDTTMHCLNEGNITTTSSYVGGIVGQKSSYGYIQYCRNNAVVTGSSYVGGIVGTIGSQQFVNNCRNTGDVTGTAGYTGGIIGSYSSGTTSLTDMYEVKNDTNSGAITGTYKVAGIVGSGTYCRIRFCQNRGDINGTSYHIGGIAGYNSSYCIVSGSDNYGNVTSTYTGTSYTGTSVGVGGIVGQSYYNSATNISAIDSCNNYGDVRSSAYATGGIVGMNYYYGHVNKSFNYGKVTGTYYVGGVAGLNRGYNSTTELNNAHVMACGNSGDVTGTNYVGGVVGRNGYESNGYYSYVQNSVNHGRVSGDSYVGGIVGQNYGTSGYAARVIGCLNAGIVEASTNYAGGISGQTYSSTSYGIVEYCLNVGNVKTSGSYKGGVEANTVAPTSSYFDTLMCPAQYYYGTTAATSATGQRTSALTDGVFNPSATYFTATAGLYPRPTAIADKPMTILAATPVFLDEPTPDHVEKVTTCYTVGTGNNVSWTSDAPTITSIAGSNGVPMSVGNTTIIAHKDSLKKEVDVAITSVPPTTPFTYTTIIDTIGKHISGYMPSLTGSCVYFSPDLPEGLVIDPNTGEISGMVLDTIKTSFHVVASCTGCIMSQAIVNCTIVPMQLCVNSTYTLPAGEEWYYDKNYTRPVSGTSITVMDTTVIYAKVEAPILTTDFAYTGSAQTYTLPVNADSAFLQVWGAQGGAYSTTYANGGKGGYSEGTLPNTAAGQTLSVYVGGKGTYGTSTTYTAVGGGGWNGGGSAGYYGGAGGGASDIRINGTTLYSRVIVAGGGGGANTANSSYYANGGYGGGLTGGDGSYTSSSYTTFIGHGGTQTAGGIVGSGSSSTYNGNAGTFGVGGNTGYKYDNSSYYSNGAGGGGWYGGGAAGNYSSSSNMRASGGGGGSGYVYTAATANNYPSGCMLNSNYYLTNAQTIAGDQQFPAIDGTTETGHEGDGYARITAYLHPSTKMVIINTLPEVTATISGDTNICGSGAQAKLKIHFTGGAPYTYRITGDVTDRTTNNDNVEIIVSPTTSTVYSVTYVRSNVTGCEGAALGLAIVDLCGDSVICAGDTVTLPSEYTWYTDAGLTNRLNRNKVVPSVSTTYYRSGGATYHVVVMPRATATLLDTVYDACADSTAELIIYFTGNAPFRYRLTGDVTDRVSNYNTTRVRVHTDTSAFFNIIYFSDGSPCSGTIIRSHAEVMLCNQPLICAGDTVWLPAGQWYLDAARTQPVTTRFVVPTVTTTYYAAPPFTINYNYTGAVQTLTVPAGVDSLFLQVWGAQGGSGTGSSTTLYPGGKGGYSQGMMPVSAGDVLNVYVGGQGKNSEANYTTGTTYPGGFNGGGAAGTHTYSSGYYQGGSGGGATDIRVNSTSLYARAIVAGGGGGTGMDNTSYYGGVGGGTSGTDGGASTASGSAGTPTAGGIGSTSNSYAYGTVTTNSVNGQAGSFGLGGNGGEGTNCSGGSGGGGGWYGGGGGKSGSSSTAGGGGGGSGYVYTSATASNYPNGCLLNSNYYLADAVTIAGNEVFPATDGTSETGHAGNGYARITYKGSSIPEFKVIVHPKPTVSISDKVDTICGNESDTIDITFTGTAPFFYRLLGDTADRVTFNNRERIVVRPEQSTDYRVVSFNDVTCDGNIVSQYTRVVVCDQPIICDGDTVTLPSGEWYYDSLFTRPVRLPFVTPHTTTTYYTPVKVRTVRSYAYTGAPQVYVVPDRTDSLKLEVWGAQGGQGGPRNVGGKGGYSYGTLTPNAGDILNVYVGGAGEGNSTTNWTQKLTIGGWNGGGNGNQWANGIRSAGGGATDIRINSNSLYSRVIVAGGGGGMALNADYPDMPYIGGYGGGLNGGDGIVPPDVKGHGGTQTAGGACQSTDQYVSTATFGEAATINSHSSGKTMSGGGGGWYGGGIGTAAGGGSGYVYTYSTFNNYPAGCLLNSNYYLSNAQTIGGDTPFISPNGTLDTGHVGNGYARITRYGDSTAFTTFTVAVNQSVATLQQNSFNICDNDSVVLNVNFVGAPPFRYRITGDVADRVTYNFSESIVVRPDSSTTYVVTSFSDAQCPGTIANNYVNVTYCDNPIVCQGDTVYLPAGNWYWDVARTRPITTAFVVADSTMSVYTGILVNDTVNFRYTGTEQTYIISPDIDSVTMQVWGAQGGTYSSSYIGGKGGYSEGRMKVNAGDVLYVYVGEQPAMATPGVGSNIDGGFNGGGKGHSTTYTSATTYAQAGGGATDIRVNGNALYSRVIVAGGGSGSTNGTSGWAGGGASGLGYNSTYIATQTAPGSGGSFGKGGDPHSSVSNYNYCSAGGGGGWYGGGANNSYTDSDPALRQQNGGGSGYVYTSATASNYPAGCLLNSSNYLDNAQTIAGNTAFPDTTYLGTTETGHEGHGYARIIAKGDRAIPLKITVHPVYRDTIKDTICAGQLKGYEDSAYFRAGVYTHNHNSVFGCDSTTVLRLYVKDTFHTEIYDTICAGDVFNYSTSAYTQSGRYRNVFTAFNNCDSIVMLNLFVRDTFRTARYDTICRNQTYTYTGNAGNVVSYIPRRTGFNDTVIVTTDTTRFGCDSNVVINLHINDTFRTVRYDTICRNAYFTYTGNNSNSINYIPRRTGFNDTIILTVNRTVKGCDSTLEIRLHINDTFRTQRYDTICRNETFTYRGNNGNVINYIPHRTNFNDTVIVTTDTTRFGCDSNVVINLHINDTFRTQRYDTICRNETFTYRGNNGNVINYIPHRTNFNDTVIVTTDTTRFGCDSNVVINLHINDTFRTVRFDTICRNAYFIYTGNNGNAINYIPHRTGFNDTTILTMNRTVRGCDSTIEIRLHINDTFRTVRYDTICRNAYFTYTGNNSNSISYIPRRTNFSDTTILTVNSTIRGCDSTIEIRLHINDTFRTVVYDTICRNAYFTYTGNNGNSINYIPRRTNFSDTTILTVNHTVKGCDSTIEIRLHINDTFRTVRYDTICRNAHFTYTGNNGNSINYIPHRANFNDTTILTVNRTVKGCDSTIEIRLHINDTFRTQRYDTICRNAYFNYTGNNGNSISYIPNRTNFNDTTILTVNRSVKGCDSTIEIRLHINDTFRTVRYDTICRNAYFTYTGNNSNSINYIPNRTNFSDTTILTINHTVKGCDSTIEIRLHVNDTFRTQRYDTICAGQSFTFEGTQYWNTTTFVYPYSSVRHCDSNVVVNIWMNDTIRDTITRIICPGTTFDTNNQSYSMAGQYTQHLRDNNSMCFNNLVINIVVSDTLRDTIYDTICTSGSVTINNETYTRAGTYRQLLKTPANCDLALMVYIAVADTIRDTIRPVICAGATHTENGVGYTHQGLYRQHLHTAAGCDSIQYIDLTVNDTIRDTITRIICAGHTFDTNNQSFSQRGQYTQYLRNNTTGCFNDLVINIVVHDTFRTQRYDTICRNAYFTYTGNNGNSISYIPNRENFNDTVIVTTNRTVLGCDSNVVINLHINDTFRTVRYDTICRNTSFTYTGNNGNSISYIPRRENFNDTTILTVNHSMKGCDSTIEIRLHINDTFRTVRYDTICRNTYFTYSGNNGNSISYIPRRDNFNDTTILTINHSVKGCDSTIEIRLHINDTFRTTRYDTICRNAYFTYNGNNGNVISYIPHRTNFSDTVFVTTDTSRFGCDSNVVIRLHINDTFRTVRYDTICRNAYFTYTGNNGNSINYIPNRTNFNDTTILTVNRTIRGCDSTIEIRLHINDTFRTVRYDTICRNAYFTYTGNNGNSINYMPNRDNFNDTTILTINRTVRGCDSTIEIRLHINDTFRTVRYDTICRNAYFTYTGNNGNSISYIPRRENFNDTTIVTINRSVKGCDSTIEIRLHINDTFRTVRYDTICRNTYFNYTGNNGNSISYIPRRDNFNDTTIITINRSVKGCDSTMEIRLHINDTFRTLRYDTICRNSYYTYNGNNGNNISYIPQRTNFNDTVIVTMDTSRFGCDSTVEIHLHINDTIRAILYDTICRSDIYVGHGITCTPSAHVYDTVLLNRLVTNLGCDSVIELHLHVNDTFRYIEYDTICRSDVFLRYGLYIQPTATVRDTVRIRRIVLSTGCDSVLEIHVHVNDTFRTIVYDTICRSDVYVGHGITCTPSASVRDTVLLNRITLQTGCDSVIELHLYVKDTFRTFRYDTICAGQSFTYERLTFNTSQTFLYNHTTQFGCDSNVVVSLHVNDTIRDTIYRTVCAGGTFDTNGESYYLQGVYTQHLRDNSSMCFNNLVIFLNVNDTIRDTVEYEVCAGRTYTVNNETYSLDGWYRQDFRTNEGCDSILHIHLIVADTLRDTLFYSICSGKTLDVNGVTYSTTGWYRQEMHTPEGCDSVLHINLYIEDTIREHVFDTICYGNSYTFNDSVYRIAGVYRHKLTTADGCDSIAILHLHVNDTIMVHQYDTLCVNETYTFFDTVVGRSGVYYHLLPRAVTGCDSTVVLHLFIRDSIRTILYDTICNNTTFAFGDTLLARTGRYYRKLTSYTTCDSIIILNLKVLDYPMLSITDTGGNCQDSTITLTAHTNGNYITWTSYPQDTSLNGQEHNLQIYVSPTRYTEYIATVDIQPYNCVSSEVISLQKPVKLEARIYATPLPITTDNLQTTFTDVSLGNVVSRKWLFHEDNPTAADRFAYDSITIYAPTMESDSLEVTLMVTNNLGCHDTVIKVYPIYKGDIFVPNAFTPGTHGSGNNYLFKVGCNNVTEFEISIYSRTGLLVFHSTDPTIGWDGTHNYKDCVGGSYVYVIRYKSNKHPGQVYEKRGSVMLIR